MEYFLERHDLVIRSYFGKWKYNQNIFYIDDTYNHSYKFLTTICFIIVNYYIRQGVIRTLWVNNNWSSLHKTQIRREEQ